MNTHIYQNYPDKKNYFKITYKVINYIIQLHVIQLFYDNNNIVAALILATRIYFINGLLWPSLAT